MFIFRINVRFIRFSVSLFSHWYKCFSCRNWEDPWHRHYDRYCGLTPSCGRWSSRRPPTTCRHRRRLLPNSNTEWARSRWGARMFAGRWMPSLNVHEWRHLHANVLSYEKRIESAGCTWCWCRSSAWLRCLSGQEVPKIRNVANPFMFLGRYDDMMPLYEWRHAVVLTRRSAGSWRCSVVLLGSGSLRSTLLLRRSRNACRWRRRWRRVKPAVERKRERS